LNKEFSLFFKKVPIYLAEETFKFLVKEKGIFQFGFNIFTFFMFLFLGELEIYIGKK